MRPRSLNCNATAIIYWLQPLKAALTFLWSAIGHKHFGFCVEVVYWSVSTETLSSNWATYLFNLLYLDDFSMKRCLVVGESRIQQCWISLPRQIVPLTWLSPGAKEASLNLFISLWLCSCHQQIIRTELSTWLEILCALCIYHRKRIQICQYFEKQTFVP